MALIAAQWLPLTVSAAAMIALAIGLLWLDWRNTANRLFAAFLLMRAGTFLSPSLANRGLPPGVVPEWNIFHTLGFAFVIPLVPLIIYFLSVYPRRRGWLGHSKYGGWFLLGVTGALLTWYFVDPTSFGTPERLRPGHIPTAAGGYEFVEFGPLSILAALRLPVMAVAAMVLARDYYRNPSGSSGFSNFLMFAGFAWSAIFDSINASGNLGWVLLRADVYPWSVFSTIYIAAPVLTGIFVAAALIYISRAWGHERDDATLQEPRRFVLYALPVAILLATASRNPLISDLLGGNQFIIGLNRMVLPFLITYALFRFSLFDTDVRIKTGLKRTILLVALGATFFFVTEAMEALLTSGQAVWFGLASTMALAILSKPIQAFAERLANGVMPDTHDLDHMSGKDRMRMYREQYTLVERDGIVTPKERQMLDRLAGSIGMSPDQQQTVEAGGSVRLPTPERIDEAGPTRRQFAIRSALTAATLFAVFTLASTILEMLIPVSDFTMALVVSGGIALMLGPIERVASRLAAPPQPPRASNLAVYRHAVETAWEDANISRRERNYLDGLADFLAIPRQVRRDVQEQFRKD